MKTIFKSILAVFYSSIAWIIPILVYKSLLMDNPDSLLSLLYRQGSPYTYTVLVIVSLGFFHQFSNWLTNKPFIRRSSLIVIFSICR